MWRDNVGEADTENMSKGRRGEGQNGRKRNRDRDKTRKNLGQGRERGVTLRNRTSPSGPRRQKAQGPPLRVDQGAWREGQRHLTGLGRIIVDDRSLPRRHEKSLTESDNPTRRKGSRVRRRSPTTSPSLTTPDQWRRDGRTRNDRCPKKLNAFFTTDWNPKRWIRRKYKVNLF